MPYTDKQDGQKLFASEVNAIYDGLESAETHIARVDNPHTVTKAQVGLSNVDNTSDADKPVSSAQQSAISLKADTGDLVAHTTNISNPHGVTKAQVGLPNVDNTSDAAKPVSTAQQTALNGKANVSHTHVVGDVDASGTRNATTFLRGDGAWATPVDTNTTYAALPLAEAQTGTATTLRTISADVLKSAIVYHAPPTDISGKANVVHSHIISDTTGLQAALDNKTDIRKLLFVEVTVNEAVGTEAKTATVSGYTPTTGDILRVTFTNGNNAFAPTLSINGGAAIPFRIGTSASTAQSMTLGAGYAAMVYYDGSSFQQFGAIRATDLDTTYSPLSQVQAQDSASTTAGLITGQRLYQAISTHAVLPTATQTLTNKTLDNATLTGIVTLPTYNAGIELGSTITSNTPYIDFHTTNSANDWDARIVASGGTEGVNANGNLNFSVATISHNGSPLKGLPSGGNTGQVLKKTTGSNYDVQWGDPTLWGMWSFSHNYEAYATTTSATGGTYYTTFNLGTLAAGTYTFQLLTAATLSRSVSTGSAILAILIEETVSSTDHMYGETAVASDAGMSILNPQRVSFAYTGAVILSTPTAISASILYRGANTAGTTAIRNGVIHCIYWKWA